MTLVWDTFKRTAAGGWGSTPSGLGWQLWGADAADRSVTSGAARVTLHQSPGTIRGQYIDRPWGDGEVLAHLRVGQVSETESLLAGALLRYTDSGYYRVRVVLTTTGTVDLDATQGTTQLGDRVATGLSYGAGTRLRLRARVDDRRIRARVWAASGLEPSTWQVDQTVPSGISIPAGNLGVFTSAFANNTNQAPWVEFERVEIHYPLLVGNALTGQAGQQVTNTRLAESAETGAVTISAGGARAVYDDTHTVRNQPAIRIASGHHRQETPRLRVGLPSSGPWSARWYTWVPRLQDAGHGIGEVRSAVMFDTHAWVVHATAAGNIGSRLHLPDLAAPAIQWDTQDGVGVTIGQWWRVEMRYTGSSLQVRAYPGHSTTGYRSNTWEGIPDPGRVLGLTGYRWRRDRPLLMWGDQGSQVATLQNELIDLGYDLSPWYADGDFGEGTHNVVMQFQTDYGLSPVDGAAGPETRAAIDLARGLDPAPLWVSHLAVSDGEWIGPTEPDVEPPEVARWGFTVGMPI
ncbi:peptidoglycan-binding domain-containing protein [Nocardiopsis terrae]|uniref:peptidoglycan-binding domain-containing protein n=1 Tax=Streptomyces sp. NPDC057554 TaxID=3350538 RepID=UPI003687DC35